MMRLLPTFLILLFAACSNDDSVTTATDNDQVQNRGADKDNWWDSQPRPEYSAYERISQSEDWFEVYRIDDDIFAIYEPGHFEEVISFLIEGEDFALMFDTGLGIGNIRAVVDQLTDKNVVVLNSHTHYDHIGGNHLFDTIYGTALPYTAARAAGSPPSAVAGFMAEGWIWKPLPEGFVTSEYQSHAFDIDRYIAAGEVIDIGGRQLEILFTPGHAPDSICLLDRENRQLFTGDTFYLAPLYTHIEGSNFDDYRQSASRLRDLAGEIDEALTSHNVPIVSGHYMVALGDAFDAIANGTASDFVEADGNREYQFGDFSVIVKTE